jgi:pyridoxine 4-dehydrogenase
MVDISDSGQIIIGKALTVNRIGLGTNRIAHNDKSIEALKNAVKDGINFIDTASAYSGGASEEVIGETLASDNDVVIATKGGMVAPDFHIDSRPETLDKQLAASLKKLKRDTIDLYFLHRVDPDVPLRESLLFLKQMQEKGKLKHIGLSQVSIAQIEEARKYIDIAAVENEYNLSDRSFDDVVSYCEKENVVFMPFFPLHFEITNEPALSQLREKYNATAQQLALAWLLKRSPMMLPIPGSLSAAHLEENFASLKIELSVEDFAKLSESAS